MEHMKSTDSEVQQAQANNALESAVVCTLGVDDRAERRLEWTDLGALALTSDRIEGGVATTYPTDVAEAVEDLAQRESNCCGSWLSANTERMGDVVRLEITTENPDGLSLILKMAGHPE